MKRTLLAGLGIFVACSGCMRPSGLDTRDTNNVRAEVVETGGCMRASGLDHRENVQRYRETPFGREKEACLAIFFIAEVGHDAAGPELLSRFGRTPYTYDRVLLVRAAGYGDTVPIQYRPLFVAACHDEHELVRMSALLELVESGGKWERELIDESANCRETSARTLATRARNALVADEQHRREYVEQTWKHVTEHESQLYAERYRLREEKRKEAEPESGHVGQ